MDVLLLALGEWVYLMKITGAFLLNKVFQSPSSILHRQFTSCHRCKPSLCAPRGWDLSLTKKWYFKFSFMFSVIAKLKRGPGPLPVPLEHWEYSAGCTLCVLIFALEGTCPGVGVAKRGRAEFPAPPYTCRSTKNTIVTVACQELPAASDTSGDPASKASLWSQFLL